MTASLGSLKICDVFVSRTCVLLMAPTTKSIFEEEEEVLVTRARGSPLQSNQSIVTVPLAGVQRSEVTQTLRLPVEASK